MFCHADESFFIVTPVGFGVRDKGAEVAEKLSGYGKGRGGVLR